MTQYGISVTFDDEEKEALQAAIDHYLEVCRREIKKGSSEAFLADKHVLTRHPVFRRKVRMWPPNLSLFDHERRTLEAVLKYYSDTCERETANGVTTPFSSHHATIAKILERMSDELWRVIIEVEAIKAARAKSKQ